MTIRFEPQRVDAITEGAIWDRRYGGHESSVKILRAVHSRIGSRILVRGVKTGRQWVVNPNTLLNSYDPRTMKTRPPL